MIIELRHLPSTEISEIRDWILENSPDSKILVGPIGYEDTPIEEWSNAEWGDIKELTDNPYFYDYFALAIDISDKDAVHFKLAWG